jgi:hypothetical protein
MKKIVIAALLFAVASCSGAGTGATGGGKREDQSAKQDSAKHAGIPWGKEKDGFSCRAILLDYALIEEKKVLKIECEVQIHNNSGSEKEIIIYPDEGMCLDLPFVVEIKGKEGWGYFDAGLVSTNTSTDVTLKKGETVSTILKVDGPWKDMKPGTYSFRIRCGQESYGFGPLWSNAVTLDVSAKGEEESGKTITRDDVRKTVEAKYSLVKIESIEFKKEYRGLKNVWVIHALVSHPKHDTSEGPGQKAVIVVDSATGDIIKENKARHK